MSFIQLISYRTHEPEKVGRLLDEWITNSAGQRTATRTRVGKDRNDPTRYVEILEFPSYEEAMRNSQLDVTTATDARFRPLIADLTFTDLDLVRDEQL